VEGAFEHLVAVGVVAVVVQDGVDGQPGFDVAYFHRAKKFNTCFLALIRV
jgi:hypothetical protein